jgi:tetratricopeptide (TPR) repeat protein
MTLNTLGVAYRALGRLEEAVTCYQNALVICRETGDRYGEGQTVDNLGDAYQDLGQLDRAAACWQDAAQAMRDVGDHQEAARLDQLAADARSRSSQRDG